MKKLNLGNGTLNNIQSIKEKEEYQMFLNKCSKKSEICNPIDDYYLYNGLSIIELEEFFNKFNYQELSAMNLIFEYVMDQDLTKINEIKNRICEEKEIEFCNYYICSKGQVDFSLLDISNKLSILNEKELKFLYDLVEDAEFYLSSIDDYQDGYKNITEDFDIDDYPIIDMSKLENLIYNELNKRNHNKCKIRTLKR